MHPRAAADNFGDYEEREEDDMLGIVLVSEWRIYK
jgi:hypothetical protein